MKKLILAMILMMSFGAVYSQQKIGHINSQKLLDTLPSRKEAVKQLRSFEEAGINELQEMEADLEKAYRKYMADQGTLTPVMRQYEEERIQKKQQALQMREQELQQQISMLGNELNAPILKRVQKAVDIVADRKKFNYIIDESVTLYFKGGIDLTSEVMTELLRIDLEETKK
jgi:outer membrane protein